MVTTVKPIRGIGSAKQLLGYTPPEFIYKLTRGCLKVRELTTVYISSQNPTRRPLQKIQKKLKTQKVKKKLHGGCRTTWESVKEDSLWTSLGLKSGIFLRSFLRSFSTGTRRQEVHDVLTVSNVYFLTDRAVSCAANLVSLQSLCAKTVWQCREFHFCAEAQSQNSKQCREFHFCAEAQSQNSKQCREFHFCAEVQSQNDYFVL